MPFGNRGDFIHGGKVTDDDDRRNEEAMSRMAKEAGVPRQWVTGDRLNPRVDFTESIVGRGDANTLYATARSTGGGQTDMSTIPWDTSNFPMSENVNFEKHWKGNSDDQGVGSKKWRFQGSLVPNQDGEGRKVKWDSVSEAEDEPRPSGPF
jgi:hypothetical protein